MNLVLKLIAEEDVTYGEYVLMCARRDYRSDNPRAIVQQPCRLYWDDDGELKEVVIK